MKKILTFLFLLVSFVSLSFANGRFLGITKYKLGATVVFMEISEGEILDQYNENIPSFTSDGGALLFNLNNEEGKTNALMIWSGFMQLLSSGDVKIKGGDNSKNSNAKEELEFLKLNINGKTGEQKKETITSAEKAIFTGTLFFEDEEESKELEALKNELEFLDSLIKSPW